MADFERWLRSTGGGRPLPDARQRMAAQLYAATGWDIFSEASAERPYVSRLWAEDWDSPEDVAGG
jgi:hypothetical protein